MLLQNPPLRPRVKRLNQHAGKSPVCEDQEPQTLRADTPVIVSAIQAFGNYTSAIRGLTASSLPTFQMSPVGSSDWSKRFEISSQAAEKAPLPARPAGSEVSFTSIPAGQAGTGIARFTPFWLIEKRIHLRGKHAGVFKSG